jgi:DNA polymerase-3 subunit gamma/tau
MTQALYRKWRPAVWSEVKYQTHVVQTLKNAIASDKLAHAYIFSGPRGTGKTTAARLLAKAVNCTNPDKTNRPCDTCPNCLSFNKASFIDLIEIDAASHTGIDDARDLIEKVGFLPNIGDFKIYIIDEVHMLSKAAFNALLKTIEEPPPHVIFILATTELDKVMPTILSRCQRFEFKRFPLFEISDHLAQICAREGIEADEEALVSIARSSSGGMRDAISLLDQLGSTGEKITIELVQRILGTATNESVIELLTAIIAKDTAKGVSIAHEVLNRGASAQSFSRQVVEYLRSLLLVQTNNEDLLDVTPNVKENIKTHAAQINTGSLLDMIREFNNVIVDNRMGWSPSLNVEMAIAKVTNTTLPSQQIVAAAPIPPSASTQTVITKEPDKTVKPAANPIPPSVHEQKTSPSPEINSETVRQAESKQPSAQEPAARQSGTANQLKITPEQAKQVWEQVDQLILKRDKNYEALFKSGKLREIEQHTIVIVFPSEILAQKFDSHKERPFVEEAFSSVLGTKVEVRAVVNNGKSSLPPHLSPDGMVAVAQELGGQLKN